MVEDKITEGFIACLKPVHNIEIKRMEMNGRTFHYSVMTRSDNIESFWLKRSLMITCYSNFKN